MKRHPVAAFLCLLVGTVVVAECTGSKSDGAAYIASLAGLGAIAGALFLLHGRRWPLHGEVALLAGIALQYLFAPAAHRFFTSGFRQGDFTLTADRAYVKGAYPEAVLIVLLFVLALFATMRLLAGAGGRAAGDELWTPRPDGAALRVVLGLATLVWAVRVGLLATGSYYHIHRSDFQFVDWRYSAMSQINGTFGLVTLAALFALHQAGRLRRPWLLVYVGADLFWNFASGSREPTLLVGLALLLAFVLRRGRWPWRLVATGAVAAMLLIGFMDLYRYAVRDLSGRRELHVGTVTRAVDVAALQARTFGASSVALRSVARLNDLESIAALCLRVPRYQPYLDGETYATVPAVFVPRALWPAKPSMVLPLNRWFFRDEGGTCPVTTMGEGYLNFGMPGVLFAGVAAGMVLFVAERILRQHRECALSLGFYVCFLLVMSRLHTQSLATWIGTLGKLCLALVATRFLLRLLRLTEGEA